MFLIVFGKVVFFLPISSLSWSLSSKCLFHIQVAMNKILCKVWNLPHRSHTSIVHCTADIPAICNIVDSRSCKFLSRSLLFYAPIVLPSFANRHHLSTLF